jgi:hypothetical protein
LHRACCSFSPPAFQHIILLASNSPSSLPSQLYDFFSQIFIVPENFFAQFIFSFPERKDVVLC